MVKEIKLGRIDVRILARVSAHGGGLYLYLPKDIAGAYGIVAGDRVEVQLMRHFKPVKRVEVNES